MTEKEYIAKEFVIDAIEELKAKPMPKALLFDHLTKLIEIFPTEDFAPVKHGHWVSEYDCGYITPHCSECGETALTKEETSYDYVYSSYCPHCGAKNGRGDNE